ncbi:glycosyltransferase, group 2 family protein [Shuttleworthella satelles DSM 14600]|uniref:Glycosyltransferase, group 2 family protein n=2 Tax=Shuttleworthella TaxID=177971 RepID=C4GCL0_9FIRM|nr:glycosyltransferase, group 2 family protein [Shuttleworthia satelles DSM 14600]
MVPCYNEEENVIQMHDALTELFRTKLEAYDYEFLFIDNKSTDRTRELLRGICEKDQKTKAIFNMKNFGQFNSPYYGITQTSGDCTIPVCCDFQDPLELIPMMIQKWEEGNKVICMVKTSSKESSLMYFLRGVYYKLIHAMSNVDQIQQFTGFGLYDRSFVEVLRQLKDPTPFIRGIVAEYAPDHLEIAYEQPQRKAGRTHNNFFTLFDAAMLSFTSYTKGGLRLATFGGFAISALSFLVALIYLILKILYWDRFGAGSAPILIGVFFFGGLQMFFVGLLGEYIMSVNTRVINRPLVIEEERLNFKEDK